MASTRLWHALAVALAAALAFAPSLLVELLGDDRYLIPERLPMGLASFWTEDYWAGYTASGLYRPLGLSWLWLQRQFFRVEVFDYHLVSLVLHAAASVLFYLVMQPLGSASAALAAAMLFALHPIHAEAVIPIYGQLDLLAAILVLLAILAARRQRHVAGVPALGAAMLVKESAFPGLGLLWLVVRPSWRSLVPYAAVTVVAAGARFAVLGALALPAEATVIGPNASWTLWVKSIVISVAHAIRLCVWPTGQTVYYGHLRDSLMGFPSAELTWLATAAMVAGALFLLLPRRDVLLGLGWFGICLLPVANVVPIGVLVAERSLYLAVGGMALLAARVRPVLLVGVGALAALAASWQVSSQWRSQRSLWESTVAAHPRSPKAHAMVGWAMLEDLQGESGEYRVELLGQAEAAFQRALALNPRSSDAIAGRAVLRWQREGCPAARQDLDEAARAKPPHPAVKKLRQDCGF
jgi:protein O-mannosyl-transferase